MIVVDASLLTDFLLGRRQAIVALEDALGGHDQQALHAPELIEPETLNALRRLALAGSVTDQRATEAAFDLACTRLIRYPHGPLRERIWDLRHNLTAYDATYLALAEALGDTVLLTVDAGLAACARGLLGRDRVRHVS